MAVHVLSAFTKAVSWTAGVVEGLVRTLVSSSASQSWVNGPMAGVFRGERFHELRAALLGRHRRHILGALGAPPTAGIGFGASVAGAAPVTFWQATTWYYPFDPGRRQAIAIRFVRDRARHVEFIGGARDD
jgi:hypothetical protein